MSSDGSSSAAAIAARKPAPPAPMMAMSLVTTSMANRLLEFVSDELYTYFSLLQSAMRVVRLR